MDGLMHREQPRQGPPGGAQRPAGSAINPQDAERATSAGLGETEQASPEEQALYNKFVGNAMKVIYNEKTFPRLLEMLQGGGDPVEGLARATVQTVARTAASAEQNGQELTGDVLFNAGTEIFNQLADVAHEADIAPFQEDRDLLEAAYFRALDEFRTLMMQSGRLNPEDYQSDLNALMEMSENGELEQMLLRLAENDPRMPANDDEDGPVRPSKPMANEGEKHGKRDAKTASRGGGDGLMVA